MADDGERTGRGAGGTGRPGTAWRGPTRRGILRAALAGACSVAAHPLLSTVTFAAAPGENRLVVIILRGAMDGLDLVQPYGDPMLRRWRRSLSLGPGAGGALDLDGFFALHPAAAALMPLWRAGELGFVQAVSTPYRDKRSHFDGQDLLEAGTGPGMAGAADGWLNRLLAILPGVEAQTAFSIGMAEMPVLRGPQPFASWAPQARLQVSGQTQLLLDHIYHEDPLFRDAATEAQALTRELGAEGVAMGSRAGGIAAQSVKLAEFAADRLNRETRIAAFSLNGWDTHREQAGLMARQLDLLARTLLALRDGLGPNWARTAVVAMTEFGRTVAENGSRGTDHGTGGAMILAGGAVRGGRVHGRWPGLAPAELYEGRDLMPTGDVRSVAGWAMRGLFGLDRGAIEGTVFPGLDLGADPGILL